MQKENEEKKKKNLNILHFKQTVYSFGFIAISFLFLFAICSFRTVTDFIYSVKNDWSINKSIWN